MQAVSCRECKWGSDIDDKRVYCYDQDEVRAADDCCHRFKEPERLVAKTGKVMEKVK